MVVYFFGLVAGTTEGNREPGIWIPGMVRAIAQDGDQLGWRTHADFPAETSSRGDDRDLRERGSGVDGAAGLSRRASRAAASARTRWRCRSLRFRLI